MRTDEIIRPSAPLNELFGRPNNTFFGAGRQGYNKTANIANLLNKNWQAWRGSQGVPSTANELRDFISNNYPAMFQTMLPAIQAMGGDPPGVAPQPNVAGAAAPPKTGAPVPPPITIPPAGGAPGAGSAGGPATGGKPAGVAPGSAAAAGQPPAPGSSAGTPPAAPGSTAGQPKPAAGSATAANQQAVAGSTTAANQQTAPGSAATSTSGTAGELRTYHTKDSDFQVSLLNDKQTHTDGQVFQKVNWTDPTDKSQHDGYVPEADLSPVSPTETPQPPKPGASPFPTVGGATAGGAASAAAPAGAVPPPTSTATPAAPGAAPAATNQPAAQPAAVNGQPAQPAASAVGPHIHAAMARLGTLFRQPQTDPSAVMQTIATSLQQAKTPAARQEVKDMIGKLRSQPDLVKKVPQLASILPESRRMVYEDAPLSRQQLNTLFTKMAREMLKTASAARANAPAAGQRSGAQPAQGAGAAQSAQGAPGGSAPDPANTGNMQAGKSITKANWDAALLDLSGKKQAPLQPNELAAFNAVFAANPSLTLAQLKQAVSNFPWSKEANAVISLALKKP
jgi:hypothetical protein